MILSQNNGFVAWLGAGYSNVNLFFDAFGNVYANDN